MRSPRVTDVGRAPALVHDRGCATSSEILRLTRIDAHTAPGSTLLRRRAAEQAQIEGSELRVVNEVLGHLGLFAVNPDDRPHIDRHLTELIAEPAP
ncbi:hypothetical protein Acsp06_46280 [Actinomycetospora sp. NBRC 106375]|nr:hypothetical protein Acsp06_46280 [Actinomycetospora sp. NBRC 106375]